MQKNEPVFKNILVPPPPKMFNYNNQPQSRGHDTYDNWVAMMGAEGMIRCPCVEFLSEILLCQHHLYLHRKHHHSLEERITNLGPP